MVLFRPFLDEFTENISEYEAVLKDKIHHYKCIRDNIIDEIEIHTVHKNMFQQEYKQHANQEATDAFEVAKKKSKELTVLNKDNNSKLRSTKVLLSNEQAKHMGNNDSIDHLLYCVLEQSNIKRQHFHGGSIN